MARTLRGLPAPDKPNGTFQPRHRFTFMDLLIVIAIVSAALIGGAVWGAYGPLPKRLEGALIALAGGALIVSVMLELVEPASETLSRAALALWLMAGATTFTVLNTWVDHRFEGDTGGGLLLAITLDGIPENAALGVALIGASAPEVAALAGAIVLSNLPEAAGGARAMAAAGLSKARTVALWTATALLLAVAAWAGNILLQDAPDTALSAIRAFAAGAVVASLATEVFPKAYREDNQLAGIAVTFGLVLAFWLSSLSGG